MKEKNCSNCAAALDVDSVFCASCGTVITQTTLCPKCEQTISTGARYCKYCAFDLFNSATGGTNAEPPGTALMKQHQQTADPSTFAEETLTVQAYSSSAQAQIAKDDPRSFISPLSAIFVLICFLLPWVETSGCNGQKVIVTGVELVAFHWAFLSAPLLGIIVLVVYSFFKRKRVLFKARPFIIGTSAIAFCLAVYFYSTKSSDVKLKSGFFGTVVGFVLTIVGSLFMRYPNRGKSTTEVEDLSLFQ